MTTLELLKKSYMALLSSPTGYRTNPEIQMLLVFLRDRIAADTNSNIQDVQDHYEHLAALANKIAR